jgi:predicted nucleic acid-binding protein
LTTKAFVDSSGFFALLVRSDHRHARIRKVFADANSGRWQLVTSTAVVFETHALLLNRARAGRKVALLFLNQLERTMLHVERSTVEDERAAIALVRQHADKSYSLCDALSFVICERLEIDTAISADLDFRQYGRFHVLF